MEYAVRVGLGFTFQNLTEEYLGGSATVLSARAMSPTRSQKGGARECLYGSLASSAGGRGARRAAAGPAMRLTVC